MLLTSEFWVTTQPEPRSVTAFPDTVPTPTTNASNLTVWLILTVPPVSASSVCLSASSALLPQIESWFSPIRDVSAKMGTMITLVFVFLAVQDVRNVQVLIHALSVLLQPIPTMMAPALALMGISSRPHPSDTAKDAPITPSHASVPYRHLPV